MPRSPMCRARRQVYICARISLGEALLRAWRKHGHGRIIGVQHATAPFWHLYYFDDPRSLSPDGKCVLPLPDCLAVNSAVTWMAFIQQVIPRIDWFRWRPCVT